MMHARMMVLFALSLGLAACAGPRWQTVYQYEPPTGQGAEACAQRCVKDQQACRFDCEDRHQHCLNRAELAARDGFDALMYRYDQDMRLYSVSQLIYEAEWDRYQHRFAHLKRDRSLYESRCKNDDRDRTACELAEQARRELRHLEHHRPHAPSRPYPPSLVDEIAEAQSRCSRDCGCIQTYNACYAACGGRVIPQQRCIAHCPDDVKQFEPVMP